MELKQRTEVVPEVEVTEIIKVDQETGELYVPKEVTEHLALIERSKKEFEAYEKRVREMLKSAMEEYGVKTIDTDDVLVNYIKASESESVKFSEEKLRNNFPDIYSMVYDDCTEIKTSKRKAYVTIKPRTK